MKHIRPLAPIEDEHHTHYHPGETVVFAPDWNGVRALRDWVEAEYQVPLPEAPLHGVLCEGAARPTGEFTTIYPVKRPEDLLDQYAEASSPAPDPSIEELRAKKMAWKLRLKTGEFAPGESEEEARWQIGRCEKRIARLFRRLNHLEIQVREAWDRPYPAVFPDEVPA
jgi:hypothetical protein